MESQSFEDLKNFVSRYQYWEQKMVQMRVDSLQQFVNSFAIKDRELNALAQKTTPLYNVFEILKIGHYETKVHTPFLAHLLNPRGSHHQGRLFFEFFCSEVLRMGPAAEGFTRIQVQQERRNDFGQIDMQIRYEDGGQRKAVVIENKIYHHDEAEQLSRYYQYMKRQHIADCNLKLVYLTPHGGRPTQQSMGQVPESCLLTLSYRDDIAQWLTGCLQKLEPNSLFYIIKQYLKIITNL